MPVLVAHNEIKGAFGYQGLEVLCPTEGNIGTGPVAYVFYELPE